MFFITTVIAIIQNVSANFKKVKTAAIMCFKVSFQKGNLKDDTVTQFYEFLGCLWLSDLQKRAV